jgi:hypothetical protein
MVAARRRQNGDWIGFKGIKTEDFQHNGNGFVAVGCCVLALQLRGK